MMALVIMLKLNRSYRNMDKYQIKMINENTNDIVQIYYIERHTSMGVSDHINTMKNYVSKEIYFESSQV